MCKSLAPRSRAQTDNHASTSSFRFYRPDALHDAQLTVRKHWMHFCNYKHIRCCDYSCVLCIHIIHDLNIKIWCFSYDDFLAWIVVFFKHLQHSLVLLFAMCAVPIHDPASLQNSPEAITTRASLIISRLKQTSGVVSLLMGMCRLRQNVGYRGVIEDQLRTEYQTALYQSDIPRRMVPELASVFAHNTVTDVELAEFGGNVLVCFLCVLGQVIMSSFIHAVLCLWYLTTPQCKGLLFGTTITDFGWKEVITVTKI